MDDHFDDQQVYFGEQNNNHFGDQNNTFGKTKCYHRKFLSQLMLLPPVHS